MERWPHQVLAAERIQAEIEAGTKALVCCAPPRAGKTVMMGDRVQKALSQGKKVAIYAHRIMLTEQLSKAFEAQGIWHGVRASGFSPALLRDVQICSLQTDYSRAVKGDKWQLHEADEVIIDEAHQQRSEMARRVIDHYKERGAFILGFTATPVGIAGLYDKLLTVAKNSDLRNCKAHLPCHTYGPDEPDLRLMHKNAWGHYSNDEITKGMHFTTIFGRVWDNHRKINPEFKPSILFAPGVEESKWFVDRYLAKGIKAAHIDGDNIYVGKGIQYGSDSKAREDILAASAAGEIKVICNRFVLRQAIDMPWLYHGIMATVMGTVEAYVQAGSRILNHFPGYTHVKLQDHGGHWWRFGSLNDDREWFLDDTDASSTARAQQKYCENETTPKDKVLLRCPQCEAIRKGGPTCPFCGFRFGVSTRMVIQVDGTLKKLYQSDIAKQKKKKQQSANEKQWNDAFYGALKSTTKNLTMKQVLAIYKKRTQNAALPYDEWGHCEWKTVPKLGSAAWKMTVKDYYQKVYLPAVKKGKKLVKPGSSSQGAPTPPVDGTPEKN